MDGTHYINSTLKEHQQLSALTIRLDTSKLLDDIELFLRGQRVVLQPEAKTGKIRAQKVNVGKHKANDLGVQSIMSFVTAIINPHAVQGNIDTEVYESYIYETHINLVTNIVVNCYKWGIEDEDIDPIVDFIMSIVQLFVSRAVDNKERESYGESIKYLDGGQTQEKKSMFFK